jgi:hypothetical protein
MARRKNGHEMDMGFNSSNGGESGVDEACTNGERSVCGVVAFKPSRKLWWKSIDDAPSLSAWWKIHEAVNAPGD